MHECVVALGEWAEANRKHLAKMNVGKHRAKKSRKWRNRLKWKVVHSWLRALRELGDDLQESHMEDFITKARACGFPLDYIWGESMKKIIHVRIAPIGDDQPDRKE
jgi:hypothetical protein